MKTRENERQVNEDYWQKIDSRDKAFPEGNLTVKTSLFQFPGPERILDRFSEGTPAKITIFQEKSKKNRKNCPENLGKLKPGREIEKAIFCKYFS